jgi:3,4-dihydroxy 2-butanone 4-phosphate synthase / GTP cyclohydrolase II
VSVNGALSGFSDLRLMTVKKVSESSLPTRYGKFRILGYETSSGGKRTPYVVLIKGELGQVKAPLVRIHSQCLTGDVFASTRCDCGDQLKFAMRAIHRSGEGVIIYHPEEGRGIGLLNKLVAYELQDKGADTVEANRKLGFDADERNYQACAEILKSLGIGRVRLLSNNPQKVKALQAAGLKISERVSIEVAPRRSTQEYLRTKKKKLGHLLTRV